MDLYEPNNAKFAKKWNYSNKIASDQKQNYSSAKMNKPKEWDINVSKSTNLERCSLEKVELRKLRHDKSSEKQT